MKYLLEEGANPDQKALCGATAMHFAAECGNLEIVKELMKHGAKMTKNEHGKLNHNMSVLSLVLTY